MASNNFDFTAWNNAINGASGGLKLFLAEQLLMDSLATMTRFRSPLRSQLNDLVDELADLRNQNKKLAEAAKTQGPATEVPENPNPVDPSTTL